MSSISTKGQRLIAAGIDLDESIVGVNPEQWYVVNYIVVATKKCLRQVNLLANNLPSAIEIQENLRNEPAIETTINFIGSYSQYLDAYQINGEAAKEIRENQENFGTYPEQVGTMYD